MAEELIKVPDIGGAEGAEIVEVLVGPGESIDVEQSLVVVESDKASMEIPAPMAGTVAELRVAVGDTVSEGDVILALTTEGAASASDTPVEGDAPGGESESSDALVRSEDNSAPQPEAADLASASASAPDDTSAASLTRTIEVKIPDLGSDQGADLVEVLVPVGGEVEEGDSLVLLESDKASMEVPAPAAGTVLEWLVETGATLTEGVVIARLTLAAATQAAAPAVEPVIDTGAESSVSEPSGRADQSPPATASSSHAAETPHSVVPAELVSAQRSASATGTASDSGAVYAGPAVRKLAREFGVSLSKVSGTGAR